MKYWAVIKEDGTFAGIPCLTVTEAQELARQHEDSVICELCAANGSNQVWPRTNLDKLIE